MNTEPPDVEHRISNAECRTSNSEGQTSTFGVRHSAFEHYTRVWLNYNNEGW